MTSPPDYRDALRYNAAAAALRPASLLFQVQMGDCFQSLASYDHALECYRTSLALKPESSYAHTQASMALYQQKKYAEALSSRSKGCGWLRRRPRTRVPSNATTRPAWR